MSDLEILGIYFAHFQLSFQDDASAKLYLNIWTHQPLVCSWKFILPGFPINVPGWACEDKGKCHHWIMFLHHHLFWSHINLYCFTPCAPVPKYVIFVILSNIFFSPQIISFTHSLYAASPLSSLRSMLSWTSSGIITFVIKLISLLALPSLDLNNENVFFKAIFSWYTYFSWRVIVLSVIKCWWMLPIYVMPNIFSVCFI